MHVQLPMLKTLLIEKSTLLLNNSKNATQTSWRKIKLHVNTNNGENKETNFICKIITKFNRFKKYSHDKTHQAFKPTYPLMSLYK